MSRTLKSAVIALGLFAIVDCAIATDHIFVCGNHEPHHIAQTPEEAKALTDKHGCKKWDVVAAQGMSAEEIQRLRDAVRRATER